MKRPLAHALSRGASLGLSRDGSLGLSRDLDDALGWLCEEDGTPQLLAPPSTLTVVAQQGPCMGGQVTTTVRPLQSQQQAQLFHAPPPPPLQQQQQQQRQREAGSDAGASQSSDTLPDGDVDALGLSAFDMDDFSDDLLVQPDDLDDFEDELEDDFQLHLAPPGAGLYQVQPRQQQQQLPPPAPQQQYQLQPQQAMRPFTSGFLQQALVSGAGAGEVSPTGEDQAPWGPLPEVPAMLGSVDRAMSLSSFMDLLPAGSLPTDLPDSLQHMFSDTLGDPQQLQLQQGDASAPAPMLLGARMLSGPLGFLGLDLPQTSGAAGGADGQQQLGLAPSLLLPPGMAVAGAGPAGTPGAPGVPGWQARVPGAGSQQQRQQQQATGGAAGAVGAGLQEGGASTSRQQAANVLCVVDSCKRRRQLASDGTFLMCRHHMLAAGRSPARPMCEVSGCERYARLSSEPGATRRFCAKHMLAAGLTPLQAGPGCKHPGCNKLAQHATGGDRSYCPLHMAQYGQKPEGVVCGHAGCSRMATYSSCGVCMYCVWHMREHGLTPMARFVACEEPGCRKQSTLSVTGVRRYCRAHMAAHGLQPMVDTPCRVQGCGRQAMRGGDAVGAGAGLCRAHARAAGVQLRGNAMCAHEGCQKVAQYSTTGLRMYCDGHMRAHGQQPRPSMVCSHPGCTAPGKLAVDGAAAYCKEHMQAAGLTAAPSNRKRCTHSGCTRLAKRSDNGEWLFCKTHMREHGLAPFPAASAAKAAAAPGPSMVLPAAAAGSASAHATTPTAALDENNTGRTGAAGISGRDNSTNSLHNNAGLSLHRGSALAASAAGGAGSGQGGLASHPVTVSAHVAPSGTSSGGLSSDQDVTHASQLAATKQEDQAAPPAVSRGFSAGARPAAASLGGPFVSWSSLPSLEGLPGSELQVDGGAAGGSGLGLGARLGMHSEPGQAAGASGSGAAAVGEAGGAQDSGGAPAAAAGGVGGGRGGARGGRSRASSSSGTAQRAVEQRQPCQQPGCTELGFKANDGTSWYCKAHLADHSLRAAPSAQRRCHKEGCTKWAKRSTTGCSLYCKAHMKEEGLTPTSSVKRCAYPGCTHAAKPDTEGKWLYCKGHMQQFGMWPRDYKSQPGQHHKRTRLMQQQQQQQQQDMAPPPPPLTAAAAAPAATAGKRGAGRGKAAAAVQPPPAAGPAPSAAAEAPQQQGWPQQLQQVKQEPVQQQGQQPQRQPQPLQLEALVQLQQELEPLPPAQLRGAAAPAGAAAVPLQQQQQLQRHQQGAWDQPYWGGQQLQQLQQEHEHQDPLGHATGAAHAAPQQQLPSHTRRRQPQQQHQQHQLPHPQPLYPPPAPVLTYHPAPQQQPQEQLLLRSQQQQQQQGRGGLSGLHAAPLRLQQQQQQQGSTGLTLGGWQGAYVSRSAAPASPGAASADYAGGPFAPDTLGMYSSQRFVGPRSAPSQSMLGSSLPGGMGSLSVGDDLMLGDLGWSAGLGSNISNNSNSSLPFMGNPQLPGSNPRGLGGAGGSSSQLTLPRGLAAAQAPGPASEGAYEVPFPGFAGLHMQAGTQPLPGHGPAHMPGLQAQGYGSSSSLSSFMFGLGVSGPQAGGDVIHGSVSAYRM